MKKWMKLVLCVVIVQFILIGGTTICSAQTKKPIKFVMVTDLTGPAHAQCAVEGWAAEDYFKWLSKNGGIDGHPTDIEIVDTKYALPQIRSAYARVRDDKQTTLSFDALSGGIEAMRGQFAKDKIPVLMITGHGPALFPPAWVIATQPPYDDTLCTMADWIAANWKKKEKPRLALLLGDYASGRAPAAAKWYCEKKGIDVVAVEYCPLLPVDTSDMLLRIRNSKADFIFDTLMPDQAKVVLKDRLKLGIKIPQVTFIFNSEAIMRSVPKEALAGYMGFQSRAAWWEKDVPGIKLAYQLYKNRGDIPPYSYSGSLGACMVWAEAVRNALRKVGYEKLDGPAIFEGYMAVQNFTAQGIFKNISYTRDDLRGCNWLKICKFNDDGSLSNVTGWMAAPAHLRLKAEMEKKSK